MQLCNAMLRLNGSNDHVIPMTDLTPAEILILMNIHGAAGNPPLIDIRPTRMDKRSHAEEWERLARKYDALSMMPNADGTEHGSIMSKLWPGAQRHKLPVTLDDINMGHLMDPNAKPEASNGEEAGREAVRA